MAENMNKWLDENPEVEVVDLWHNDGSGFCHCPKCTPVRAGAGAAEAEAAYAKTYIRFTNREDIGFFRRIGVDGLSSDLWEADWCPLNMYAFGKLTWNPDLKTEKIIADFCRRYYSRASDPMIAYWNLLEEGLRESWNTNGPVNWRNQQRAALIEKALSQAESVRTRYRIHATFAMHRSYWPE